MAAMGAYPKTIYTARHQKPTSPSHLKPNIKAAGRQLAESIYNRTPIVETRLIASLHLRIFA